MVLPESNIVDYPWTTKLKFSLQEDKLIMKDIPGKQLKMH